MSCLFTPLPLSLPLQFCTIGRLRCARPTPICDHTKSIFWPPVSSPPLPQTLIPRCDCGGCLSCFVVLRSIFLCLSCRVSGGPYSVGASIRDVICSRQPVSGWKLTATHSVKHIASGCLYSLVPEEVSCCKVARWSELVCTGSKRISRSIL